MNNSEITTTNSNVVTFVHFHDKIVTEALSWVDTPYHHQARVKGIGVDCCNLIAAIGENVGLVNSIIIEPYNLQWHLHSSEEIMLKLIESYGCKQIEFDKSRQETWPIGSIATFRYGRANSHLGIIMPNNTLIHAAADYGKVVHSYFDDKLLSRLQFLYTYPIGAL